MDRWVGKIAVVTGAATGIGAAIAADLLAAGVVVVGLDRSVTAEQHRQEPADPKRPIYWLRCDVTHEQDIRDAFAWVDERLGGVDILVNNAGVLRGGRLTDADSTANMALTLQVNVLGVAIATREAFLSMQRRRCGGHVVIINSVAGHAVPFMADHSFNMYPASKHAITAMTEVLRQDFIKSGLPIKISVGVRNARMGTHNINVRFIDPNTRRASVRDSLTRTSSPPIWLRSRLNRHCCQRTCRLLCSSHWRRRRVCRYTTLL